MSKIKSVAKRKPADSSKRARRASSTKARVESKQTKLIAMLRMPEGATVARMMKAFGWQPHTVRGLLSGVLKKKLGMTIKSEKTENGDRVYRIA